MLGFERRVDLLNFINYILSDDLSIQSSGCPSVLLVQSFSQSGPQRFTTLHDLLAKYGEFFLCQAPVLYHLSQQIVVWPKEFLQDDADDGSQVDLDFHDVFSSS